MKGKNESENFHVEKHWLVTETACTKWKNETFLCSRKLCLIIKCIQFPSFINGQKLEFFDSFPPKSTYMTICMCFCFTTNSLFRSSTAQRKRANKRKKAKSGVTWRNAVKLKMHWTILQKRVNVVHANELSKNCTCVWGVFANLWCLFK